MTTNNTNLSTKYAALIAEGKTQEEALLELVTEATKKAPKRDNIAYILSLRDIPEVRRVKKIAYAKISKSKENAEAVARYQLEIAESDKKLNDLLMEVNEAKVPWEKAMELGEDARGAFQYFITPYRDSVDKSLAKKTAKKAKSEVKAEILKAKAALPTDLPEVFHEVATERVQNGDMMLITVFRKVEYLKSITK